jgi:sulfoxide reductase heme-binding subunit YedZ
MNRLLFWKTVKIIVFIVSLFPFFILLYETINNQLGANPIETLHFKLGDWALRFLCLGLVMSPLKKITQIKAFVRFKRMLGLYAFFYASLHFLVYICLDIRFSMEEFTDEVSKSPYIIVGLLAYSLLIPLAFTSTKSMQKRLRKKWKTLHKLVYLVALLAVIHFLWLVKLDRTEPLIYAALVVSLLCFRCLSFNQIHDRIGLKK